MPESMQPSSSNDNVGERASHHPGRNAADQLDDQTGHTHALPREKRDGRASWLPKHPGKRRVRETIEDTVLSDKKSTGRYAHDFNT
jgi:hypothetical protein